MLFVGGLRSERFFFVPFQQMGVHVGGNGLRIICFSKFLAIPEFEGR